MDNRQNTISQAIDALETGKATPANGQDPHEHADMLRTASERGGLGAYAAYKTAQRLIAD